MTDPFPDTTAYHAGKPTELTQTEIRRGPSLGTLWLLMVIALVTLLLSISHAFAGEAGNADSSQKRSRITDGSASGGRPARIDPGSLVAPATQLLMEQSAALGDVKVQVNPPDARLDLPACTAMDAFLPPGARAQGHTTVGVRCSAPTRWTVYLQAQVQVFGNYIAAARPLAAGQILAANDLVTRTGDLTELPAGVVSDADTVIGRPLISALTAGQPVRRDGLKVLPVIQAGQAVRLVAHGQGFQIASDGVAAGNAGEGQTVQVRTAHGTMVSGTAHTGSIVEVHL